jgi:hypothetical protein
MAQRIHDMIISCKQAGADVGGAFGDDLYVVVDGQRFSPFNSSFSGFSDQGAGFRPGQVGFALTGGGTIASDRAVISFFDRDDTTVDGFTGFFEGGDDFIGSVVLFDNVRQPTRIFNIQGEGSSYDIQVTANFFFQPGNHDIGKVALKSGGVMNGQNTAGTLVGLGGKDIINANNGDDILLGGNNDDILNGGNGDDILFGGKGKDILRGGAGADVFVIAPKTGLDIGKDFHDGQDLLGLGGGLSFQDLSFVQQAKGTLIEAGSDKLMFLQGVATNQLTATDFTQVNLGDLDSSAKAVLSAH